MKKLVALSLVGVLGMAVTVSAETLQIDAGHSQVRFRVRQFLGTVEGSFGQVRGTVRFDRAHPENSSVEAEIPVKTIDTGIKKRDHHLLGADFFNADKFPLITFKSLSVRSTGKKTADVTGEFSMHGVSKTVTFHAAVMSDADGRVRWRLTTQPLARYEYGLHWSAATETASMIGKDVEIELEIEATASR